MIFKSPLRIKPRPCRVCGVLFSHRPYPRINCDLHHRKFTPESAKRRSENIRQSKVGKKRAPFSKEWKDKMRASAQHGAKCWRWKGGVNSINEIIRKSAEYNDWRKEVFKRDNWTCVLCSFRSKGTRPSDIQADHIKPFAKFPELRFELLNGRTLCKPCHRATDTYGDLRYYKDVSTKPS